jgi:hypothetical protein
MAKKDNSKPLPLWSKGLILLVAIGMVGVLASVILLTAGIKYQIDNSQDPSYIRQVASKMIRLPNPLPKDYQYLLGADLWFAQVVSIDYKNGYQRLVFVACPTDKNSQQMLTDAFERGMITAEAQTRFTSVITEGGWLIQDTQIPYRVGKLADGGGVGLVAVVSTVDAGLPQPGQSPAPGGTEKGQSGRALILYALQPKGETFDMKVCTDLLQPF